MTIFYKTFSHESWMSMIIVSLTKFKQSFTIYLVRTFWTVNHQRMCPTQFHSIHYSQIISQPPSLLSLTSPSSNQQKYIVSAPQETKLFFSVQPFFRKTPYPTTHSFFFFPFFFRIFLSFVEIKPSFSAPPPHLPPLSPRFHPHHSPSLTNWLLLLQHNIYNG